MDRRISYYIHDKDNHSRANTVHSGIIWSREAVKQLNSIDFRNNHDLNHLILLITYIDILLEATDQIYRVLYKEKKQMPLPDDTVFLNRPELYKSLDDRQYFKEIRALLTAIIQSSSASVGILQALSATGAITFGSALPIILGQNIGTCVTALLSSIGTSKNAKRVAVVHLYFNIIGTLLFLTVFYLLNAFIGFSFVDGVVGAKEIAIVHTIFNLSTSIVLLPFIKVLEKLAYLTVKDKEGEGNKDNIEEQFKLLDERFLQSPSFAVEKCRELTNRMGEIAKESIDMAMSICVDKYDKEKAEQIAANEAAVDLYEDRLGTYLVKLSSRDLSAKDSQSVSTILHVIGDFERISDHAMNMVSVAEEKQQKDLNFTSQATAEVKVMCSAVRDVLDIAMEAFEKHDLELATRVEPLEEVVDKIRTKLKNRHVKRLQTGECTIEMGFVFSDLLTNLERVSDHCSNIAVCLIQENDESFDVHEYVQMLKNSGEGFDGQVKRYSEKYALPAKEF